MKCLRFLWERSNNCTTVKMGTDARARQRALFGYVFTGYAEDGRSMALVAQPWQTGLLFEPIKLAVAGAAAYRRAWIGLDPAVWAESAATEAVVNLLRLRNFVDDDAWSLPWQEQLARVGSDVAALQVTGDWARAAAVTESPGPLEWAVPGAAGWIISIVGCFTPLTGASAAVTNSVAAALTTGPFQHQFALIKGCMPAVHDAWLAADPQRARHIGVKAAVLSFLTFDQCCGVHA